MYWDVWHSLTIHCFVCFIIIFYSISWLHTLNKITAFKIKSQLIWNFNYTSKTVRKVHVSITHINWSYSRICRVKTSCFSALSNVISPLSPFVGHENKITCFCAWCGTMPTRNRLPLQHSQRFNSWDSSLDVLTLLEYKFVKKFYPVWSPPKPRALILILTIQTWAKYLSLWPILPYQNVNTPTRRSMKVHY